MAKDDPADDGGTNEPDGIDPILERMPPRGKRKKGGKVDGKQPKHRLDKRARGGSGIHIKPSHKGLLHKDLGVSQGKPIPEGKLKKAMHSSDPAVKKRAVFAENAKHWHH